jgi:hypothetical protein
MKQYRLFRRKVKGEAVLGLFQEQVVTRQSCLLRGHTASSRCIGRNAVWVNKPV